uniref:Serine-rich 25 kDa antigen protein n=1 Tax=Oryza punctata TaxID=4537 RepID=A0A0E0KMG1_ORYPU
MPPPTKSPISLPSLFSSLPRRRPPLVAGVPSSSSSSTSCRLPASARRSSRRPPTPRLHRRSQEPIAMPASDKQLASTVKKVTSRELPKKGADIVNMSQGISPLPKDKGPATDSGKTVGTKRSDAPSSPGYHNVYVRRKVENDHSKVSSSQEVKGNGRDKTKEQETQQNVQHDQTNKPELSSSVSVQHDQTNKPELSSSVAVQHDQTNKPELSYSVTVQHDQTNKPELSSSVAVQHDQTNKPGLSSSVAAQHDQTNKPELSSSVAVQHDQTNKPELSVAESGGIVSPKSPEKPNEQIACKKNEPPVAPGTTVQDDTHKSSNQYWNARFNRLQTYLESCDRSSQEGYMRMLRSLSAADRSMHAIDLEKRAIHLLVEEGKELQRMKALNVLGKVSPNGPSKQAPL